MYISKNDKMNGMKRFKDANKDWVSSYFPEKRHHTKLAISHISREEFFGAGPTTCLSISHLWQYNDTLRTDFRKNVNLNQ